MWQLDRAAMNISSGSTAASVDMGGATTCGEDEPATEQLPAAPSSPEDEALDAVDEAGVGLREPLAQPREDRLAAWQGLLRPGRLIRGKAQRGRVAAVVGADVGVAQVMPHQHRVARVGQIAMADADLQHRVEDGDPTAPTLSNLNRRST